MNEELKEQTKFIVLGVHNVPVIDEQSEADNPYFFNTFDKALELAIKNSKYTGCPHKIAIVKEVLVGITTDFKNTSPALDYVPITIRHIEDAEENASKLNALVSTTVCKACGARHSRDEFVPNQWMQVDVSINLGIFDLIWICPKCIAKKYKDSV